MRCRSAAKTFPIEATVAAMDAADVGFGLPSAWRGPNYPMIGHQHALAG